MNGKFLRDTNIVIAIFAEEDVVQEPLAAAAEVFLPVIALGELYFGAKSVENLARIDEFAAEVPVLTCDTSTALHYGQIKSLLRTKGRPIPENDIWIAALAKQYDLTVVTRDRHYEQIDDLAVEAW